MAGLIARGTKGILSQSPHDVVFLSALRTPITRSKRGSFKDAFDHELLASALRAILSSNPNLDPSRVQDIQIGTVLSELGGSKAGRMAACHVGFPETTAFQTVNRACSSGLAAITGIALQIQNGMIDIGIGGGMESMTMNYGSRAIPTRLWQDLKRSRAENARDCIMSMGITADNVAQRYSVSREEQDEFAVRSHMKAARASENGLYDEEIIPVRTIWHPNNEQPELREEIIVAKDDGIRPTSSPETLAKMKPAFQEFGTATAANSSQVSDGAAAALMMRRSTAHELGLSSSILGKWAGTQIIGCRPDEMGIGPALAIPKLLNFVGLDKEDIGIWEINEAFASQAVYCIRKLAIDEDKVNPKGGAIALGHPLGATGARQVATLLPELKRQGEQLGVVSMCIGTGMGMASLIVRE